MPPAGVLEGLTEEEAMRQVSGLPHSIARITAHMNFWQRWFLSRCRGEDAPLATSAAVGWPAVEAGSWTALREQFLSGIGEAAAFDPDVLDRPLQPAIEFPPLANYTIGDALTHIASHNAHHLGQIVTVRQLIGSWPPPGGSFTW